MPIFSTSSANFYSAINSPGMEWAQEAALERGIDVGAIVMGAVGTDETSPVVMIAKSPPGSYTPRHAHDTYRVEILLQGSIEIGGQALQPGDVSISAPGEFYGPNVVGPEGCVTAEIFAAGGGILALFPEEGATADEIAMVASIRELVERTRAAARIRATASAGGSE